MPRRGRRGHEMLDRAHPDAEGSQGCRPTSVDHMVDVSGYEGAVGGSEENPGVGCCGRESQLDGVTGMKPDSLYRDLPPDGPLVTHSVAHR